MALLAIVMAIALPTFIQFNNTESRNETRQQTIDTASIAMSRITKALRATAIDTASNQATYILPGQAQPNSIEFYSNINVVANPTCPELVSLALNTTTGSLSDTETTPVLTTKNGTATQCTWPSSNSQQYILATNITPAVVNGSTVSLFQYFDAANPATPQAGVVNGNIVTAVQIDFSASSPNSDVPPTQYSERVRLATPTSVSLSGGN